LGGAEGLVAAATSVCPPLGAGPAEVVPESRAIVTRSKIVAMRRQVDVSGALMSIKARQSMKLTEPQTSFLNTEAGTLGVTVAELVRRIIDQYRLNPPDNASFTKSKIKTLAAILAAAALSIGMASAQSPIGQVPVYFPRQAPAWTAPVTGHPAPYMPPPQSSYTSPPVYFAPVTAAADPYSSRIR
jgi:hypothetical protein